MRHGDRPDERDETGARRDEPAPAPQATSVVQADSLAWASAVGNQAVQRLARQHAVAREPAEAEEEPAATEPDELPAEPDEQPAEEATTGKAPAPGAEGAEALATDEAAALAAVGDDAETLPE